MSTPTREWNTCMGDKSKALYAPLQAWMNKVEY